MRRKHCLFFIACLALLFSAGSVAALQLLDVLFLKDGTSVSGVIMEEEPGKSLVLETEDGELLEFRFRDVERIEKLFVDEEPLIQNRDVVYLKDGVVFRGTIVGRVPEKEIRLELEDGQLLDFRMNEIFKIGKEQVATGVVKRVVLKPKKEEKERIQIQIQIAMDQLDLKQQKLKQGGESVDIEELRGEVDRLKDEIEEMEEQGEVVEKEAAEEEARFAEIEGELGELRDQLLAAAEGLEGRIAACESPQVRQRLEARYADLQRSIDEMLQRAEVIALVEQPDPRVEEIKMQAKATEVRALAQNRLWDKPDYEEQWDALVAELPFEQRREIFRDARKSDSLGKALLNAIPFVGLGSWRQKDYLGGTIVVTTAVAGLAALLVYDMYYFDTPQNNFFLDNLDYIGGVVALAGYVFGIIEPFFFNAKHNQSLREALELQRRSDDATNAQLVKRERGYIFPSFPAEPELRLHLVRFEY
jgi:hypothetical protein